MDTARQAMRQLALLLIFVALAVAQRPLPQHLHRSTGRLRVAGGALATRGQFPYQAGLILDGKKFCGGALIHEQYVLTTAVCIGSLQLQPQKIQVILGARNIFDSDSELEKGSVKVQAQEVYIMGDFDIKDPIKSNTLALIKIDGNKISDTIKTIDLPGETEGLYTYTGREVTVTGWGLTGNSQTDYISYWLTFATPTVIAFDDCRRAFSFVEEGKIMCTRGRYNGNTINGGLPTGPCLGDDGAPAVLEAGQNSTLVGILSFMAPCESLAPSGFLQLNTDAVKWIKSKLPA